MLMLPPDMRVPSLMEVAPISTSDDLKSARELGSCGMVVLSSGVIEITLDGARVTLLDPIWMNPLRATLVVASSTPALVAWPVGVVMSET